MQKVDPFQIISKIERFNSAVFSQYSNQFEFIQIFDIRMNSIQFEN